MHSDHAKPWDLDRRWMNGLIVLLSLGVTFMLLLRIHLQRIHPPPPPHRAGIQGRLMELRAADGKYMELLNLESTTGKSFKALISGNAEHWDKALGAVLAADSGDLESGKHLAMEGPVPPGTAGPLFRESFAAAYLAEGNAPNTGQQREVEGALGNGYAARLLKARLLEKSGLDGRTLREEAHSWAHRRILGLEIAGFILVLLVPSGLAFAIALFVHRQRLQPSSMPVVRVSGHTMAVVFLGWFLALLSSGILVSTLLAPFPFLRFLALPMTYALHASIGLGLMCQAEGLTLAELWDLRCQPAADRA